MLKYVRDIFSQAWENDQGPSGKLTILDWEMVRVPEKSFWVRGMVGKIANFEPQNGPGPSGEMINFRPEKWTRSQQEK